MLYSKHTRTTIGKIIKDNQKDGAEKKRFTSSGSRSMIVVFHDQIFYHHQHDTYPHMFISLIVKVNEGPFKH